MAKVFEKIRKNPFVGFASRFFWVARKKKKKTLPMSHSLLDILYMDCKESRHIPTDKYFVRSWQL
jgi:hypothetical protein